MSLLPRVVTTAAESGLMPRVGLMLRNCGQALSNFGWGSIHNIDSFKNNAVILSSFLQVSSRIMVANQTAVKAKGQPDESFVLSESVKTMVREALAFFLSFIVLRAVQRTSIDVFKNMLWVKKGVSTSTPLINRALQSLFRVKPSTIAELEANNVCKTFPSLRRTVANIDQQLKRLVTGQPLGRIEPVNLSAVFPDKLVKPEVVFDEAKRPLFEKMRPIVERVHRWAGGAAADTDYQKLHSFFGWVPALIGSVPALLLSGWWLERFTQKNARSVSAKIASYINGSSGDQPADLALQYENDRKPYSTVSMMPSHAGDHATDHPRRPEAMSFYPQANRQPMLDRVASYPQQPVTYASNYPTYPNTPSYPNYSTAAQYPQQSGYWAPVQNPWNAGWGPYR